MIAYNLLILYYFTLLYYFTSLLIIYLPQRSVSAVSSMLGTFLGTTPRNDARRAQRQTAVRLAPQVFGDNFEPQQRAFVPPVVTPPSEDAIAALMVTFMFNIHACSRFLLMLV
jgi:hypothetical protein